MLITIDGSVYKYDLATRDLLFSFKTQAMNGLQLYNRDNMLIAADHHQMKLWQFIDELDDAPELKTVQQLQPRPETEAEPMKIQQIFANRDGGEAFYHCITNKNMFEIYDATLDLQSRG